MSKIDTQKIIGTLLPEPIERDAVHIAVSSVICFDGNVFPGQHIGFVDGPGSQIVSPKVPAERLIGIVDPFLKAMVTPGNWFCIFLYPNTITSLKHLWTHPAFDAEAAKEVADKVAASEAWLRNFCERSDGPSYDRIIETVRNGGEMTFGEYDSMRIDRDHFMVYGHDAHGEIPPEFWDHIEVVTGIKITKRPEYFSCSC